MPDILIRLLQRAMILIKKPAVPKKMRPPNVRVGFHVPPSR